MSGRVSDERLSQEAVGHGWSAGTGWQGVGIRLRIPVCHLFMCTSSCVQTSVSKCCITTHAYPALLLLCLNFMPILNLHLALGPLHYFLRCMKAAAACIWLRRIRTMKMASCNPCM